MDKKILQQQIENQLSTRQIAELLEVTYGTVRYWLRKYGLSTQYRKSTGECCICGKLIKKKNVCGGCQTKIRRYRNKTEAVRIKGGKCEKCGWVGPIAGYDFHHYTGVKNFSIGNVANKSWASIKKEIEKCNLLCRNCHSIEHSNVHPKFLIAVEKYKGKGFC